MGISDDIHRRKPNEALEKAAIGSKVSAKENMADNEVKHEDLKEIVEPKHHETNKSDADTPDSQKTAQTFFGPSKTKPKPSNKSIALLIILVLLVLSLISVAIYQNLDLIKKKILGTPTDTTKTSETKTVDASDTPATTTTDATSQPAATETPLQTPVAAPVIDKSSFTIRVSNGNGLKGSADSVRDILKAAGFNVTSVGNASSYNYKTTIVYFKTGKEAEANLVKDALIARSVTVAASTTLTNYDVLVIVGTK